MIDQHSIRLALCIVTALFSLMVFALIAAPVNSCSPKLGDTSAQVRLACGEPRQINNVITSYGAKREEWDYTRLVVIEDGQVIGSIP